MIQRVKGTRDYFFDDAEKRYFISSVIRDIFEFYGYGEVSTPAFEYLDTLQLKGSLGEESVKDVFKLTDKSNRKLGLRYDLTTPVSRVIQENSFPSPIKLFYFSNMWRYERPQKGRFREFWQVGIENVDNSDVVLADAENIIIINKILSSLSIKNFYFNINSRVLLQAFAKRFKVKDFVGFCRILDKKDKLNLSVWKKELSNFVKDKKDLSNFLAIKSYRDVLKFFNDDKTISGCVEYFKKLESLCLKSGVSKNCLVFDLSLARGLDYYTDFIFEVNIKNSDVGSIGGGGRYDNLIGLMGRKKMNATGFGLGFDRLVEFVNIKVPKKVSVGLISNNKENLNLLLDVREKIYSENVICDIGQSFNIKKDLSKFVKKNFDFCIILGDEEIKKKYYVLRDFKKKSQKKVKDLKILKKSLEK